jgi:cytoskeletal protein CcmA (bactofilin family)
MTSVTDDSARAAPEGSLVELNALLGRGTRYTGKLWFEGRIRIEGRFVGEIRGDDVLVIGEGAEIDADIEVGVCIVVGGTVRANIRARDAIELHVPAVVVGDLHAPNVFIDRGVQFEGKCKMAPLNSVEGGAADAGAASGDIAGTAVTASEEGP